MEKDKIQMKIVFYLLMIQNTSLLSNREHVCLNRLHDFQTSVIQKFKVPALSLGIFFNSWCSNCQCWKKRLLAEI